MAYWGEIQNFLSGSGEVDFAGGEDGVDDGGEDEVGFVGGEGEIDFAGGEGAGGAGEVADAGGEGDVDGGEGETGGSEGEGEVLTGGGSDGGDTGANVTAAGVAAVDRMFGVAGAPVADVVVPFGVSLIAPMSNMPPRMNIKKMANKKRNSPALCLLLAASMTRACCSGAISSHVICADRLDLKPPATTTEKAITITAMISMKNMLFLTSRRAVPVRDAIP